ncbi:MAG: ATP-binding protein [Cyanobacteria bacterium P01_D01_bin.105]
MTAIASPEFIALCRTQLQLLTQRLTSSSAALYIADLSTRNSEQANFVPIVSYPEPVESWVANFERANSAHFHSSTAHSADSESAEHEDSLTNTSPSQQASSPQQADAPVVPSVEPNLGSTSQLALSGSVLSKSALVPAFTAPEPSFSWPDSLHPEQRLVTPLVYTDVVVGLLVAVRLGRTWNRDEREHIERVGASLAGGCVLERRNQWLQSQLAHKRGLQSRQSEVFHNLLHQFRNPLTAVSTFGQLMVKKLGTEDPNAPIATGIVRENKRLRELVSHFDEAVAIGDADLAADALAEHEAADSVAKAAGTVSDKTQQLQLGPRQSLLPASNVSETLISEALRSADSSAPNTAEPAASNATTEEIHGLGQPLTLSSQHLPDIVEPVLAVARIVAEEKGISLLTQIATDTPPVWGEEEALGEVITNLIDNAIKYSPTGAVVWVQTGVSREAHYGAPHQNGYQGIIVGDTGPGIPAKDLPHLFERNYRGAQALSDIPGTGLGLAIAQSLIQEMQGTIEVISPAVGTPWLPMKRTHHPAGLGTVFVVWLKEINRPAKSTPH